MTTVGELHDWCMGAEEQFGDASIPICQLFFHWTDSLLEHKGQDLVAGMLDREVHLHFGGIPLLFPLVNGSPRIADTAGDFPERIHCEAYGARRICKGVYQVTPSLNLPGIVHGFVVLYDVPEPAPWERLVIVP